MLILASKWGNKHLLGVKKNDIGIERIKWQERINTIFRGMFGIETPPSKPTTPMDFVIEDVPVKGILR